jgi:hypothetical protein
MLYLGASAQTEKRKGLPINHTASSLFLAPVVSWLRPEDYTFITNSKYVDATVLWLRDQHC